MKLKKWWIVCVLAILMMLPIGSAIAVDGHNWQWDKSENGHMRYCDGCATHDNRLIDTSSAGTHTYRCLWPETEPTGVEGYRYICIECTVCGWSVYSRVETWGGREPTCMTPGYHTYEYKGNYGVPEDERYKTYPLPAVEHSFQDYKRNHDATCTENETETAKCAYSLWQEPECTATDTRDIPNSVKGHDLEHRDAKDATCTEIGWDAYDTCNNCNYVSEHKEYDAKGHNYTATTTKPTCVKGGYTTHVCTLCGDTYIDQKTAARGHWYGEWTPNAEGDTHTAECRRSGCGSRKSVSCVSFACKLTTGDQTIEEFSLCPVCGKVNDGTRLMLVESASAMADHLPYGEVLVRMGRIANGNQLMIVGFEYAGQLTQAKRPVKVSLPAELLEGCVLCLVAADGTETELPLSVENGLASFSLDFTDAQSPVRLIHILSAQ